MLCTECNSQTTGIAVYDNPNNGYAYNVYQCDGCGTIIKENVWKDKGYTIITLDDKVKFKQR